MPKSHSDVKISEHRYLHIAKNKQIIGQSNYATAPEKTTPNIIIIIIIIIIIMPWYLIPRDLDIGKSK